MSPQVPDQPVLWVQMPLPHCSTPGVLPSLLGCDGLLKVPELECAVLRGSEQGRLAVVESQGADAIIV